MKNKYSFIALLFAGSISLYSSCSKGGGSEPDPVEPPVITNDIGYWITNPDRTSLLQQQTAVLGFGTAANSYYNIAVDSTVSYQSVDGFGYTLTGGSAQLIN